MEQKKSKDGGELPAEEGWFEYQAEGSNTQAVKPENKGGDETEAIVATTATQATVKPEEQGDDETDAIVATTATQTTLKLEEEYDETKAIAAATAMLQEVIQMETAATGASGASEDSPIALD